MNILVGNVQILEMQNKLVITGAGGDEEINARTCKWYNKKMLVLQQVFREKKQQLYE
jgi:hypothetical protein